jgi:hypothetical protein
MYHSLSAQRLPERTVYTNITTLTLSNPIFLPPAYSPALIYFGRERGWWITCNYPTVLKEKNINRKSTTCTICWPKSVLHEEIRAEQENHNVGRGLTYDWKGLMNMGPSCPIGRSVGTSVSEGLGASVFRVEVVRCIIS